jgi:hypothetical protein
MQQPRRQNDAGRLFLSLVQPLFVIVRQTVCAKSDRASQPTCKIKVRRLQTASALLYCKQRHPLQLNVQVDANT